MSWSNKLSVGFGIVAGLSAFAVAATTAPTIGAAFAISAATAIGGGLAFRATAALANSFDGNGAGMDNNAALALVSYVATPFVGTAGAVGASIATVKYALPAMGLGA